MLCCMFDRRGRGSDIFLISSQNIDAEESQGGSHTGLHNILFYVAMLTL